MIELGVDTFGDVTASATNQLLSHSAVIKNVVQEAIVAERAGISFFGVGEHHRADFAVSAAEILLAAIAASTRSIRIGTAVTVLGSDDPVRAYQRFATLHALSDGRFEAILGRGAFKESFPLFGYKLADYDELFEQKLRIFVSVLRRQGWQARGSHATASGRQSVFPDIGRNAFPVWVAIGRTPASVVRAANHNLPVMLGIVGGEPGRFRPFVDLYEAACKKLGHPAGRIGAHANGFVAESNDAAREMFWPHYKAMRDRHGETLGWPAIARDTYEMEVEAGALFVGSPATVAGKIVKTCRQLGLSRFDLKYSTGTLPHEYLCDSLLLYGTEVIPMVRRGLHMEASAA